MQCTGVSGARAEDATARLPVQDLWHAKGRGLYNRLPLRHTTRAA